MASKYYLRLPGNDYGGCTAELYRADAVGERTLIARCTVDELCRMVEENRIFRGGFADLQRHVNVVIEENPTRIPPGMLGVIGGIHKAIEDLAKG